MEHEPFRQIIVDTNKGERGVSALGQLHALAVGHLRARGIGLDVLHLNLQTLGLKLGFDRCEILGDVRQVAAELDQGNDEYVGLQERQRKGHKRVVGASLTSDIQLECLRDRVAATTALLVVLLIVAATTSAKSAKVAAVHALQPVHHRVEVAGVVLCVRAARGSDAHAQRQEHHEQVPKQMPHVVFPSTNPVILCLRTSLVRGGLILTQARRIVQLCKCSVRGGKAAP